MISIKIQHGNNSTNGCANATIIYDIGTYESD
jgi:hypothetical protein